MKTHRPYLRALALAALLGSATTLTTNAGSATYNFEADPSETLTLFDNATWVSDGGHPGGYLLITAAEKSQRGTIIFKDFDNGLVVQSFTFSCDLMIGDGSSSPADGFSINFARATDPVLVNSDGTGFSAIDGGSNMPEEGTTTGLAIGFDAFQNGALATDNGLLDGDVHYDTIGLSVRVDNQIVFQKPLRTLNGAGTNVNSLQTGPMDTTNPGSGSLLTWQPFKVELTDDGKVNVWWKGTQIVTNLQTSYFPSRGQLVFSGRTGDSYQIQAVDNIAITTVAAAKPTVNAATLDAFGLTVKLADTSAITVKTNTVAIKLDGQTVTPSSITKVDDITTIRYNTPALLPSGATYPVEISFVDSTSQTSTIARDVTVDTYVAVPAALAVPAANVNKTKPGFRIRPHQVASGQPNSIAWTEAQLDGLHGDNLADLTGADATGYIDFPTVIDFKNSQAGDNDFAVNNEFYTVGIPGSGLSDESNSALEIITYLEFPSTGIYTLGVNSDDGYSLSTAANPKDRLGLVLGTSDAVAAAQITVAITEAGVYPFRLLFENGGGGAALEWYSIVNATNKVLINDTATTGAIKAYRTVTSQPVYVASVIPAANSTDVYANSDLAIKIADGDTKTLDASTVSVKLNGQTQTITTSKSGSVTTIKVPATGLLLGNTEYTATVVYGDNSTPVVLQTNSWKFTTLALATYPTELVSPVGSGTSSAPGFLARVYQVNEVGSRGIIEQVTFFEQILAGAVGPNVADLSAASGGIFTVPGTINWSTTYSSDSNGYFDNDSAVLGLPGTADSSYTSANTAVEFLTYIEFPAAGYYILGVNSDDGFRVAARTNAPASNGALVISAPSSVAGSYHAVTAGRNQTGGIGLDITNAITGKLVYANPAIADGPLSNAADIKGNIALIDRGTVNFSVKLANALDAGAIAVVIANNKTDDVDADGKYPFVQGGDPVDIASVMISKQDADSIKTVLSQGVNVTLTAPDYDSGLFEYDGGRGTAESVVGLNVTQAGVYPLRLIWFNSGGDGDVELYTVSTTDGTRTLVNDTTSASALKAYRTRTYTPITKPTLNGSTVNGKWVITYTGVLQSAATVNGTYTDVAGATSPATISTATGNQFYRARSN
jgi:hypothetical protein